MGIFRKLRAMATNSRSARAWYELAVAAAQDGDRAAAHEALRKALTYEPETADLCIQIGLSLEKLNDLESAAHALRRAIRLSPRSPQAQLQLGTLMLKHGQPQHAIPPLKEVLKLSDFEADACLKYANALERTNELEEALAYYHIAVEKSPSSVEAMRHLGRMLARMGHIAGAIRTWRRVLELSPGDLQGMTSLGILLSERGQFQPAIELLTAVARARPDSAEAYSDLGITLSRSGSHEAAIQSLRHAIQLKPKSAHLQLNLGVALMAAGRLNEAVATFWEVVSLAPEWSVGHFNVGMALKELGDFEGAKNALTKASSLAPDDQAIQAALADVSQDPEVRATLPNPRNPAEGLVEPDAQVRARRTPAPFRQRVEPSPSQISQANDPRLATEVPSLRPKRDMSPSPSQEVSAIRAQTSDLRPPEATVRAPEPKSQGVPPSSRARTVLDRSGGSPPKSERAKPASENLATMPDLPTPQKITATATPPPITRRQETSTKERSITGEIEVFPISEVLEFLKVHRSTGVLHVTSEFGSGELRMRDGNLTGASSPHTLDLITLLVTEGFVSESDVNGRHRAEPPERMGTVMVQEGVITPETLRKASLMQIQSALTELVSWKNGSFNFKAQLASEDDGDFAVDTRGILMEVMRRLDESNRPEGSV